VNLPTEYSISSVGDGVRPFLSRFPITKVGSRGRGRGTCRSESRYHYCLFICTMTTAQQPKSKSKSKQQEARQFLDDLDSLPEVSLPAQPVKTGGKQPEETGDASEVLAFIDQITQKSSEPTRTTSAMLERPRSATPVRKPTERVKLGGSSTPGSVSQTPSQTHTPPPHFVQQEEPTSGGGGWGFGGWSTTVWSSASAALQQARSVVDEQVKHLPNNDQAKKWREGVLQYAKNADLEKITALGTPPPPQHPQRVPH
jgi:hypothetical protein